MVKLKFIKDEITKIKRAILFIYIAISIGISGYSYLNPKVTVKEYTLEGVYTLGTHKPVKRRDVTIDTTVYEYSLLAEGVGLFLLFAGFILTEKKERDSL